MLKTDLVSKENTISVKEKSQLLGIINEIKDEKQNSNNNNLLYATSPIPIASVA